MRIAAVIDAETLALADGRELRLIGALPPRDAATALPAIRRLGALAVGKPARLAYGGRREDRHGRLLAHAFLEGEPPLWLQGMLVAEGLALAYSLEDNRACIEALLQREAVARADRRGGWADGSFAPFDASEPQALLAHSGAFAIVEGRVISVGERPRRTYLNFGHHWNDDFTVVVDGGDRRRFATAGLALGDLAGRRIRVRGWIDDERGPVIWATHPEQIERVDEHP